MNQLTRKQIINLSNAAYQLERFSDARKILLAWMKKYPNDLWIRYRLAIVLYKLGEFENAIRICELLTAEDPEFGDAWGLLAVLLPEASNDWRIAEYRAELLSGKAVQKRNLFDAIFGKKDNSEDQGVIEDDDFDLLTAVNNAKLLMNDDDRVSGLRIVNIYYRRWPKTLQFKLILGHILNQCGRADEGMQIIQSAVESDIAGQVPERLWDAECPYEGLWPELNQLSIGVGQLVLPSAVVQLAQLTGIVPTYDEPVPEAPAMNQVESSHANIFDDTADSDEDDDEPEEPKESDFILRGDESRHRGHYENSVFERIRNVLQNEEDSVVPIEFHNYSIKTTEIDPRSPVYVVMSSMTALNKKYGVNNKQFIDKEMRAIADAVAMSDGWGARVFYPDEYSAVSSSGIRWQDVHEGLVRLDQMLLEKGQMIGALLIVGGDDVIPFFRINNPTGDDDRNVPSDAPYGVLEAKNCFDSQWMVGRVPGDNTDDPGLLLKQLRSIRDYHINRANNQKLLGNKQKKEHKEKKDFKIIKSIRCLGYAAAYWLMPSKIVYKTIADTSTLLVCPQTTASVFDNNKLANVDYGYFNLHGIKGKPSWYGQKKADDTSIGTNFPEALGIKNLRLTSKTPKLVFAECCFGAQIIKRNEQNCISLNMLGKTTKVFIGSTVIAYGAVDSSLIAADLLGYLFWEHLKTGISAGEAFRRTRINLAMECEKKNGGLESELQKTLLSFIYLGDPLYALDDSADIYAFSGRTKNARPYMLFYEESDFRETLSPNISEHILSIVKNNYHLDALPDQYSTCTLKKVYKGYLDGRKATDSDDTYVLIYAKDISIGDYQGCSVIRVTIRGDGTIKNVYFSK